jgi:hypothetical protein
MLDMFTGREVQRVIRSGDADMTSQTEARHDVADYMVGMPTGYTGTFEAVFQVMFGPLKHDAHVRAFRAHQFYTEQKRQLADANIALRAEHDRQIAEFRAKFARNNPAPILQAAE